jgi:hypothetical protein
MVMVMAVENWVLWVNGCCFCKSGCAKKLGSGGDGL